MKQALIACLSINKQVLSPKKGIVHTPVHCLWWQICSRTANWTLAGWPWNTGSSLLLGVFCFLNFLKLLLIETKDLEAGKVTRPTIMSAPWAVTEELHLIFEYERNAHWHLQSMHSFALLSLLFRFLFFLSWRCLACFSPQKRLQNTFTTFIHQVNKMVEYTHLKYIYYKLLPLLGERKNHHSCAAECNSVYFTNNFVTEHKRGERCCFISVKWSAS